MRTFSHPSSIENLGPWRQKWLQWDRLVRQWETCTIAKSKATHYTENGVRMVSLFTGLQQKLTWAALDLFRHLWNKIPPHLLLYRLAYIIPISNIVQNSLFSTQEKQRWRKCPKKECFRSSKSEQWKKATVHLPSQAMLADCFQSLIASSRTFERHLRSSSGDESFLLLVWNDRLWGQHLLRRLFVDKNAAAEGWGSEWAASGGRGSHQELRLVAGWLGSHWCLPDSCAPVGRQPEIGKS